ncbi:DUF4232 domain-containing protein [Catenulispora yoronensis]|uniref:DUF4232 domain-containing protein n=1 Tax=Catenulispora yoronensis TaxID=450799 RepID=UPI0031E23BA8
MSRRAAVLAGAAVGTLSLLGCASNPSTSAATATGDQAQGQAQTQGQTQGQSQSQSQSCDLAAQLVKLPGVASGTTYWDLVVTDQGSAACTLPAQPQLAVLGPEHQRIAVKLDADPTAKAFHLAAGASATEAIGYGTDANPPCAVETTYLRLTPPGVDLPFRSGAQHCGDDVLSTGAWVAGNYAPPQ